MTAAFVTIHRPSKSGAEQIRAELKSRGVKANVRFLRWSYRIVLPVVTGEAMDKLRDYLVEIDFRNVCGEQFTDPAVWSRVVDCYEGRGQLFVYNAR